MNELKSAMIDAAIDEFAEKGLRFTMDDLARRLRISKKTLYTVYPAKEDLLMDVVETAFGEIRAAKHAAAAAVTDDPVEQLRGILAVLPERYRSIGLSKLNALREKHPNVYTSVTKHLSSDWEETLEILNHAVEAGRIRPISIPIFKTMYESTLEAFMDRDVLIENGITYEQAMNEMIDILLRGIVIESR